MEVRKIKGKVYRDFETGAVYIVQEARLEITNLSKVIAELKVGSMIEVIIESNQIEKERC